METQVTKVTKLDAYLKVKRLLEGMYKNPAISEHSSYNQAISDAMKQVMELINTELRKQIVK